MFWMGSIIRFPVYLWSFFFNGSDKTSFSTSDEVSSDDFRANRLILRIDWQLRGIDVNNPSNIDADGYPLDLGK
jgi:hypothetical protein